MPENRIEIIINPKDAPSDKKKTAAFPRRRPFELGRRRLNDPQIRFWDLAQVNHQALDAEPVFVDHPILKTPSYTTEHVEWGSGPRFAGVKYLVEGFENADFSAYTEMMFDYPVTEWKQRYRRILGVEDGRQAQDYRFDYRFSLDSPEVSGALKKFMGTPAKVLSKTILGQAAFDAAKEVQLANYYHYWNNDRDFAGYRDLSELTGQLNTFGLQSGTQLNMPGGYFPFSNNDPYFKFTLTNDPDAAAVDPFEPSGSYDIFLMPMPGLFFATDNSVNWKTTNVLGLCYQVMPRHLWPRYVEPAETETGLHYGSDSAVNAFIEYQKARSGMQASTWSFTGVENMPGDYSYTEGSMTVGDWPDNVHWGAGVCGGNTDPGGLYFSPHTRGRDVSDNFTQYATIFEADDSDPNFGTNLFRCDEPFLTAVIQKADVFYYCWDISHAVDASGNVSAGDVNDQDFRFRISRGVTWDSDHLDLDPNGIPHPNDGTGEFSWT